MKQTVKCKHNWCGATISTRGNIYKAIVRHEQDQYHLDAVARQEKARNEPMPEPMLQPGKYRDGIPVS